MKYIIIDKGGIETPIIFSELLSHSQVKPEYSKVISAGFCSVNVGENNEVKFSCWSGSTSLNSKSRLGVDENILKKHSVLCS